MALNTPKRLPINPADYPLSSAEFRALWDRREIEDKRLLKRATRRLPKLKALLAEVSDHWGYEDGIYRFYHHSLKMYYKLQPQTLKIVEELQALAPHLKLSADFMQIIADGTGKEFKPAHNKNWLKHTRPIVEAFFHARHMLQMACKYAEELKEAPQVMPSGWATLLYLYNLR